MATYWRGLKFRSGEEQLMVYLYESWGCCLRGDDISFRRGRQHLWSSPCPLCSGPVFQGCAFPCPPASVSGPHLTHIKTLNDIGIVSFCFWSHKVQFLKTEMFCFEDSVLCDYFLFLLFLFLLVIARIYQFCSGISLSHSSKPECSPLAYDLRKACGRGLNSVTYFQTETGGMYRLHALWQFSQYSKALFFLWSFSISYNSSDRVVA